MAIAPEDQDMIDHLARLQHIISVLTPASKVDAWYPDGLNESTDKVGHVGECCPNGGYYILKPNTDATAFGVFGPYGDAGTAIGVGLKYVDRRVDDLFLLYMGLDTFRFMPIMG